tara:strand:- start:280 stop:522 length:243 start_codon:yes stop_codon:yes gene_type:complete
VALVRTTHAQAVAAEQALVVKVQVAETAVTEDRGLEILQLTLEVAEAHVNQDLVLEPEETVAEALVLLESVEHLIVEQTD